MLVHNIFVFIFSRFGSFDEKTSNAVEFLLPENWKFQLKLIKAELIKCNKIVRGLQIDQIKKSTSRESFEGEKSKFSFDVIVFFCLGKKPRKVAKINNVKSVRKLENCKNC